jgi:glycosyltransferase involved in cell wall biosynthesis
VTLFNPLPPRRFDLIHAFNRIPLGWLPFIIGFESHLPRAFGLERTVSYNFMLKRLASEQCRRIIAISNFALRSFRAANGGSSFYPALEAKLTMRYPNLELPSALDHMEHAPAEPLIATFVGNHFGRKGGCVAVRVAELAHRAGFPLLVRIVSTLEVGSPIWTDPLDKDFFSSYFRLLELPVVQVFQGLPNDKVLHLLHTSHFSLLPTFSDTFGYSAIESMAGYTPVIATRQCAIPEFVQDGVNGVLLDLPLNSNGEWDQHSYGPRDGRRYVQNFRDEIERLAEETFAAIVRASTAPSQLKGMRKNARETAAAKFSSIDASDYWDQLYEDAAKQLLHTQSA